ncbi:MAG: thioredoxin domain-containing protein [Acidobacteriota bacterium]
MKFAPGEALGYSICIMRLLRTGWRVCGWRGGQRPARLRRVALVFAAVAALVIGIEGGGLRAASEGKDMKEKRSTPNRLAKEKSPYLLQHADNPVDWYAWGDEAFKKAREESLPIFLSIGYSTCHWCHVMAHESFENEEIAAILNQHFVSIKVDREERPDIDRVYMAFVQATTGSGGWPMSVFLTPDLKPFYGGTYFPPDSRYGRPGFGDLLQRIADSWRTQREQLIQSSNQVIEALRKDAVPEQGSGSLPDAVALTRGYEMFAAQYDERLGGFGSAPKFPRPSIHNFLLRFHARTDSRAALDMTLHTLRAMAAGGMHDHLGGGFHRYSVDERWHVPHFEKMLYDQAQLATSYLEAYQITHEPFYADLVRDILEYVLRDMTHSGGAFYSAEDADSASDPARPRDKSEGAFYVWEEAEIRKLLDEKSAALFSMRYGMQPGGNVRHDPHSEFPGKNILYGALSIEEAAKKVGTSPADARRRLDEARKKLFDVRESRPRPHLDDKIITAWNGMMISVFARAGAILGEERYLEAARRAADFLLEHLLDRKTGNLLRRYRDGESAFAATSLDYACVIQSLLDLYEATFDIARLRKAVTLQEFHLQKFWDESAGGFWETTGEDPSVLLRMKEDYDGAEPSSNSVAALNLLRLSQMTDNTDFRARAELALGAFSSRLGRIPQALPQMLVALDYSMSKPRQIVIAGKPDSADTRALLKEVRSRFLPTTILLLADGGEGQKELAKRLPFVRTMKPIDGKATAFVCENYACELPTTDPAVMARLLDKKKPAGESG